MAPFEARKTDDAALIIYCSPERADRLRIDKEHRAIDAALVGTSGQDRVTRLQASTLDDILRALQRRPYSVIQFSGHGSDKGILIESTKEIDGVLLDPTKIAAILRLASPHLKVAIFMSCFSDSMADVLIREVPYLIVISGAADDTASIEFSAAFYYALFETGSLRVAFDMASLTVGENLTTILLRRGLGDNASKAFVTPKQLSPLNNDPPNEEILIDIHEVEEQLQQFKLDKEKFLALLTHKIRIHQWAFRYPRDNALFSMGEYFALFSWSNPHDRVSCKRIMKLKADVDELTAAAWVQLLIAYHDLYVADYRRPSAIPRPQEREVHRGLDGLHEIAKNFIDERRAALFRSLVPDAFRAARAQVEANISIADSKFHEGDIGAASAYMEAGLSAIHDLINAIGEKVLE
jgi:hypothetical protein